jgi:hypothetical protein
VTRNILLRYIRSLTYRSDNLIPGMVATYRWGVESSKLVYPITFRHRLNRFQSTFGHIPSWRVHERRPNETFLPMQQRSRRYRTRQWYTVGGTPGGRSLWFLMNIKQHEECRVALVRTDVSEALSASIIRVTRIGELGTTLAVTSNRCSS